MAEVDKHQAIIKMRKSIKTLEESYERLGEMLEEAMPTDKKSIVAEMTATHKELTSEQVFLNHLEAAATEVAPPNESSYKELDSALAELQKLQQATGNVKKILQVASAIANHAANNRTEVSSRTT